MLALKDNTTSSRGEQVADPAQQDASNLASIWAQGRRRITPWAYSHLRAIAAVRLAAALFLAGLGAVFLAHGHDGWAALVLAGAALNFSIGYLDITVARTAPPRA